MTVIERLEAENTRLCELYENAVGNRERFGWTINHLLECEESLRVAEAEAAALRGAVEALRDLWDAIDELPESLPVEQRAALAVRVLTILNAARGQ